MDKPKWDDLPDDEILIVNAEDVDGIFKKMAVKKTGRMGRYWYGGNIEERCEHIAKDGRIVAQLHGWRVIDAECDNKPGCGNPDMKPCPFCGAPATIGNYFNRYNGEGVFYGTCIKCGSRGRPSNSLDKALDYWNLRHEQHESMLSNDMPDPAVRYGHPVIAAGVMVCSECGHTFGSGITRYCPDCGALMLS